MHISYVGLSSKIVEDTGIKFFILNMYNQEFSEV